ncbi:MAG: CYTH domain-containing protein [Ruminococcaceae bacterium]|nr:CYTH domain-containing protein [Oscillospiraceae bacterium]
MGREFELKYKATAQALRQIRALWQGWEEISMETTYFDTPEGALSAKHCTLRRRMENGISVCTMKTPISGFGRGEWDVQAAWSGETVAELFAKAGQEPIPFESLTAVCGARFTRLAKTVELPGCTVEIALDEGVLLGGGREIPLCELEVELKAGTEDAAIAWAQHLAEKFGLQAESQSKFRRASLLAKGEYHG